MNTKEHFSKIILDLRNRYKMSQNDLAYHLKIRRQSISKWERCESLPSIPTLIKLRDIFGIMIDEFLD